MWCLLLGSPPKQIWSHSEERLRSQEYVKICSYIVPPNNKLAVFAHFPVSRAAWNTTACLNSSVQFNSTHSTNIIWDTVKKRWCFFLWHIYGNKGLIRNKITRMCMKYDFKTASILIIKFYFYRIYSICATGVLLFFGQKSRIKPFK